MKKVSLIFAFLVAVLISVSFKLDTTTDGDRLLGVWQSGSGKANVKIEKVGTKYYGKIVWLKEPNDPTTQKPKVDKNNPDEKLKTVPLKGLRLLKDFSYKEKDEWNDGTIYDPENGSTYKSIIKMKNVNTLEIRGYIGVQAFGRTDTWKKVVKK